MDIRMNKMIGLFPTRFFEMDIDFLLNSDKLLYSSYSEFNDNNKLIIIVYFTSLRCIESNNNSIAQKCEQLLKSEFLQLEHIKNIQLCFAETNINFNLPFLKNKRISLQCSNCTLSIGIHMSDNINEISLADCKINTKLDLPSNIDKIIFRNVSTSIDITIDDKIRHIELINVTWNINVTNVKNDFHIKKYNANWLFKQIKNDNNTIKILLIGNIVFKRGNIEFRQNIDELILNNIELNDRTIFTIRDNVQIIHLKMITGAVNIYSSIVSCGLLNVILRNGSIYISISIQKDSASNESKYGIFEMCNANIENDINIFQNLSRISLINVNLSIEHLSLNIDIGEIYIRNCNGSILFNGIADLDKIHFIRNGDANNKELFIFTRTALTTTLEMKNITFSTNIEFKSKIDSISLYNTGCLENNVFTIHSYDSLIISKSKGVYRIPGILCNRENTIDKPLYISIKLIEVNTYDVEIKYMFVEQSYVFYLNINILKLFDIKSENGQGSLQFTGTCKSIELSYVSCAIEFTNVESLDTIFLRNISDENTVNTLLSIPAQHIEVFDVVITKNITLSGITKYVKIERINYGMSLDMNTITINSNCKHVHVSNNNVFINMPAILEYSNGVVHARDLLFCELITINTESHLILKFSSMCTDLQLVKKVKSLELLSIYPVDRTYTFNVIYELESLSITNCNINISLYCPDQLKYISINNSKMFYDPSVHTQVKCISLIDIDIKETLKFLSVVENVYMRYVRIEQEMCIVLGNNIASLYVFGTTGTIDMSNSIINHSFNLKDKETIELKKIATDEYSLYMCKIHSLVNFRFFPQIRTIILDDVQIHCHTLRISDVDRVEIRDCSFDIKMFNSIDEANSYAEVTSICNMCILSNIHTLKLKNKKFNCNIGLPNCNRITILEKVEMANGTQFVFNQKCEEVHLLSCKGVFNLKNITGLRRLVFISSINTCNLDINDTCLNNLYELEIRGYANIDYVVHTISLCHNLKKLILHNIMVPCEKNGKVRNIRYKDKIWFRFANSNMSFLPKIFNFNMVNKLEYLDISRLFLDYRNVVLNDFKKLHTLIVDYTVIYQISLEEIPSNIETLEFVEHYDFILNSSSHKECVKNNLKYLKTNTTIKRLTIPYVLCYEYNVEHFLPLYLEKLTIISCDRPTYLKYHVKTTKSYVKELVLYLIFDYSIYRIELEQNDFSNKCSLEYFDYLRNFIDFDKLERLAIETETDIVHFDAKTYQVK